MEPRPRNLVRAQIGHRDTDPVPYTLGFEEEVGVQLDRQYRGSQWRSGIQPYLHSVQVVDPRRHMTTDHPAYEQDVYGSLWQVDRRRSTWWNRDCQSRTSPATTRRSQRASFSTTRLSLRLSGAVPKPHTIC